MGAYPPVDCTNASPMVAINVEDDTDYKVYINDTLLTNVVTSGNTFRNIGNIFMGGDPSTAPAGETSAELTRSVTAAYPDLQMMVSGVKGVPGDPYGLGDQGVLMVQTQAEVHLRVEGPMLSQNVTIETLLAGGDVSKVNKSAVWNAAAFQVCLFTPKNIPTELYLDSLTYDDNFIYVKGHVENFAYPTVEIYINDLNVPVCRAELEADKTFNSYFAIPTTSFETGDLNVEIRVNGLLEYTQGVIKTTGNSPYPFVRGAEKVVVDRVIMINPTGPAKLVAIGRVENPRKSFTYQGKLLFDYGSNGQIVNTLYFKPSEFDATFKLDEVNAMNVADGTVTVDFRRFEETDAALRDKFTYTTVDDFATYEELDLTGIVPSIVTRNAKELLVEFTLDNLPDESIPEVKVTQLTAIAKLNYPAYKQANGKYLAKLPLYKEQAADLNLRVDVSVRDWYGQVKTNGFNVTYGNIAVVS